MKMLLRQWARMSLSQVGKNVHAYELKYVFAVKWNILSLFHGFSREY